MATVVQLFTPETIPETEAQRLRADLETYRSYLAGPCTTECADETHPHHRHWTPWYEEHRGQVVTLNTILAGEFDRAWWAAEVDTINTSEV